MRIIQKNDENTIELNFRTIKLLGFILDTDPNSIPLGKTHSITIKSSR